MIKVSNDLEQLVLNLGHDESKTAATILSALDKHRQSLYIYLGARTANICDCSRRASSLSIALRALCPI